MNKQLRSSLRALCLLGCVLAGACRLGYEPSGIGTDAADAGSALKQGWPGRFGKSGVNGDPVIARADVEAFCKWRGRACEVAVVYTDRRSWDAMTRYSDWLFDNFEGFPGQLVISQGLVPDDQGDQLPACARGDFDEHWRAFGELMVRKRRAASIVRLGWELNSESTPARATDAELWKRCYRRAALALRDANPGVKLDWTINSHGTPEELCGGSSVNCYPGDDVVDIIGIDNYDMGPSATSPEHFAEIAAAADGLDWLLDFAKAHDKKLSVGEWGVAPGHEANSTGENPDFIRWMNDWFSEHAADLAYEAYFNHCEDADVESNLYRPTGPSCTRKNEDAAAIYRRLWGSAATGGPPTLAPRVDR
jgi:hypothetical protein